MSKSKKKIPLNAAEWELLHHRLGQISLNADKKLLFLVICSTVKNRRKTSRKKLCLIIN
jgi:hypothetical protein